MSKCFVIHSSHSYKQLKEDKYLKTIFSVQKLLFCLYSTLLADRMHFKYFFLHFCIYTHTWYYCCLLHIHPNVVLLYSFLGKCMPWDVFGKTNHCKPVGLSCVVTEPEGRRNTINFRRYKKASSLPDQHTPHFVEASLHNFNEYISISPLVRAEWDTVSFIGVSFNNST